ncbi:MAG: hypothetical protein Devi2KO_01220 [Devosia indica]
MDHQVDEVGAGTALGADLQLLLFANLMDPGVGNEDLDPLGLEAAFEPDLPALERVDTPTDA